MSTFKEAYEDLVNMVSEAKKRTHLNENTLLDLMKTQLVYGSQPIATSLEAPMQEHITGDDPTLFDTEDPDDDQTYPEDSPKLN